MPSRSDDYQLPSWPKTRLDRDLWNAVMADIAARLAARELLEASFERLQEQGIQAALDYIQVSIAPQLVQLQQDIANAQAKIDEILAGNAPNAQKLGGQLPSYYATAQALLDGLASKVDTATYTAAIALLAPKASPALTGNPTATTQAAGNNSTRIATTAFIQAAINAFASTAVLKAGDSMYGPLILPASVAGAAPLNIPHGVAPTTLVNGDVWTLTTGIQARINGVSRTLWDSSNLIAATQAEAEAGTGTATRIWTPQRVSQAVAAAQRETLIDVTSSRTRGTVYQNTDTKPRSVFVNILGNNGDVTLSAAATAAVATIGTHSLPNGYNAHLHMRVPAGWYYSVSGGNALNRWWEM